MPSIISPSAAIMSRCGRCMLPMRDGDLGSGAESGSNSEAGFVTEAQSTQRDFYFKLSSRPLCAYLEIPAMIFFENGWRVFCRIQAGARLRHSSHGVLESRLTWMSPEASLRAWMPAIHAGMTASDFFVVYGRV